MQTWGKVAPVDLVYTAATELNGSSGTATYGPPYNNGTGGVQQVGPVNWQKVAGITQPINAAHVFVLGPLSSLARTTPALATALATYNAASPAQQNTWASAYVKATAPGAKKVPFRGGNRISLACSESAGGTGLTIIGNPQSSSRISSGSTSAQRPRPSHAIMSTVSFIASSS